MGSDLVKPIVGILTSRTEGLSDVLEKLMPFFGTADIVGDWQAFSHTRYYEEEMGPRLSRCFVSFDKLVHPDGAATFKAFTMEVEHGLSWGGRRTVNIDPGYIDANKVVLISVKGGGHKICLREGIYADMLLWYNKGWEAFPWAFPDFRDGGLFEIFARMRKRYKEQARMSHLPSIH